MRTVFTVDDRDRLRDWVINRASTDPRLLAGAVLGSLAHGDEDAWSDLDLMFAVADGVPLPDVLESWTEALANAFGATRLFDLESGTIVYRVFLLPSSLELDLSFTPASTFGAGGPRFRLLFGDAIELPQDPPRPADELFGYAVHHALHARSCIERGRLWQAEYWISALRDHALALACLRLELDGDYGRDFDRLPREILEPVEAALVRTLEPQELRRALGSAVAALLRESGQAPDIAEHVAAQLREAVAG